MSTLIVLSSEAFFKDRSPVITIWIEFWSHQLKMMRLQQSYYTSKYWESFNNFRLTTKHKFEQKKNFQKCNEVATF